MNEFTSNIALAIQQLWADIATWLPDLVAGIVILILGWIIAIILGKIANWLVDVTHLDSLLAKTGVPRWFERSGFSFRLDRILELVVKWFFIIAFFIVAMNTIGLTEVSDFLEVVLAYIPHLIIAAIIAAIGLFVGNVARSGIEGSSKAAGSGNPQLLGATAQYAIWAITAVAVIDQLQIGGWLLTSLIANLGLGIAIAFGIAFGWGGKDMAAEILARIRRDVK